MTGMLHAASAIWRPAATLAQQVGAYSDEIAEGETGMLFSTPDEFEAKLGGLIEDAALRNRLASNAKDWVRTNRDVVKVTTTLFQKWVETREAHKQTMPQEPQEVTTSYYPVQAQPPTAVPEINLSIIIPTVGRESLTGMLSSLIPQLDEEDEVLVIGDGPQETSRGIVARQGIPNIRYIEGPLTQRCGNAQRDLGRAKAKNKYLWFIDDDDEVLPDSLRFMKDDIAADPNRPHYYIMILNGVPFDSRRFLQGHMGTPQIVWPNRPDFPSWDDGKYGLDMETISKAAKLWPEGPVYHNRVVYRYIDPKGTMLKLKEQPDAVISA